MLSREACYSTLILGKPFKESVDILAIIVACGHQTGYKKRLDGRKQNKTCTAVPTRKGTVLTGCGIPSRITCNEIILETYPWYIRPPENEDYGRVITPSQDHWNALFARSIGDDWLWKANRFSAAREKVM